MAYSYRCLDRNGEVREGILNAEAADLVTRDLEGRGWKILQLRPAEAVDSEKRERRRARRQEKVAREAAFDERIRANLAARQPGAQPAGEEAETAGGPPQEAGPLPLRSLGLFLLQLRAMIAAGVSYYGALKALAQTEDKPLQAACTNLLYRVGAGSSLSQAMAMNPQAFSPVIVNLVQLGETAGMMDDVLGRLGSTIDIEERRRNRLKGAIVYPAFVITASFGMVFFLLYYMLPQFITLFSETGMQLPWLTRAVMATATSPALPLVMLGSAAVLAAWIMSSRSTQAGRLNLQKLKYETPMVGRFFRDYLLARLCRDLAMLLRCGTPLSMGLKLMGKPTSGYYRMDDALQLVHDGVYKGGLSLSEAMQPLDIFPSMLVQFVKTGEESGGLDDFLERFSDLTDQKLDLAMTSFLQLIEPAMMVFLGVVVGTLVLASFLPVYQLMTVL